MPNNAWLRPVGLRAFAVSTRRGRPGDGEHGGHAAGEGQRGNNSFRWSNHCPTSSRRDGKPAPDGAHSGTTLRPLAAFAVSRKPDHERVGFIP
jgi:hypothetical protein